MISFHPLSAFSLGSLAVQWSRSCDKWVKVFDLLCLSATMCVCVCGSVISFSFKSCHRPDTLSLSGEAFIRWLQMCLSSSPIIQREIGIVTLWGLIQDKIEKWREGYTVICGHAPLAESLTHTHTHSFACAHRLKITWTNSFNISVITNPYKVTRPHFCLLWKVAGR